MNFSIISIANSTPINLPPNAKTLASLCLLASSALKLSWHNAQRMFLWRFAAIEIPIPLPQIRMPKLRSSIFSASKCA